MEYRYGNGDLLTLEFCTAASNMVAGTPVGFLTGTRTLYTLGRDVVGQVDSGLLGYRFVGVLAADVSANQCPVTVWTRGVFTFIGCAAAETANACPGWPVFAESGMEVNPGTGQTADVAIGTLVNQPAEISGGVMHVRINPGAFRWMCSLPAAFPGAWQSATQACPLSYPKATGHG